MTGLRAAPSRARPAQRVALLGGGTALAAAAMLSATSLSPTADAATAVASPPAQPITYYGAAAAPAPEPAPADLHSDYRRVSGKIGNDLTRALEGAGVTERLGREYVGVLARAIPLADGLSVEDRFDLVFERGEGGRLVYAGLDRVGRADIALLKWTDGNSLIWVNADAGATEGPGGMGMPVAGSVSSRFGNRFHPILGSARFHKGVDLRATSGTPIAAAADGRVVAAGWRGGYGRQVAIVHDGGLKTTYSHMSRIAASPGATVRRGQVIGYVGSSGLSTGPHLHYEVYKNGRPVNPLSVKLTARPVLEGEKLHEFNGALREVLQVAAAS